jgi:hypothetical protein
MDRISQSGHSVFLGAGTYRRTLQVPPEWLVPGRRVQLDLGDVNELAAVRLNGRSMGTAWRAPFLMDLTDAMRPRENRLEITVVNLWAKQAHWRQATSRQADRIRAANRYRADARLLPSGRLGPVRLLAVDQLAP